MAQGSCGGFAAGVDPLAGYSVEYLKEYIRDREVRLGTGAGAAGAGRAGRLKTPGPLFKY